METIYNSNPRLDAIFDHSKDRKRVLIVPIDYAKSTHTVLFANGIGDQVRAPFNVCNNREGCAFLGEAIHRTIRKRKVKPHSVIIAGEGLPSFARLFLANLQKVSSKFELFQVHALDAKERRPSNLASTDKADLVGIAQCVLERRARSIRPLHTIPNYTRIPHTGPRQEPFLLRSYEDLFADTKPLRELTRARHRIVQLQTKSSNTLHALVDQLFPGFLDRKCPIFPFTKASLKLLDSSFFSSEQIARKRPETVSKYLAGCQTRDLKNSVHQLIETAQQAHETDPGMRPVLQSIVKAQVAVYRVYKEQLANLDFEIEGLISRSPASFLLSFGGIGMTLAAGIYAELGPSLVLHPSRKLCAYAGVVPRTKQSGGPDQEAHQGKTPKGCNRILKNYLVQAANQIGRHGPEDLRETYENLKSNDQHADYGVARRLLRMFRLMMIRQTIYLPPEFRNPEEKDSESRAAYLVEQWSKMASKWSHTNHFVEACQPENPLGLWAQLEQDFFENSLKRPLELPYCLRNEKTEATEALA